MSFKKRISSLALLLAMVFCQAVPLSAQVTATVTGVIKDEKGDVIAGASVTATNTKTNSEQTVSTSSNGDYVLTGIAPGTYIIRVEAQGFQPVEQTDVDVQVAAKIGLNFTLNVGSVSAQVTVVGSDAPLVETVSSSISTVVSQEKIINLPLNGRDAYNLITLQPGITPDPNGRGEGVSSNGQRGASANYMLDGYGGKKKNAIAKIK